MNSIYAPETIKAIEARIDKLQPDSQRLWGKMNVAQMMTHCTIAIESAIGDEKGKLTFMGRIFGGIAKKSITSEKPFGKNLPTAKSFIVVDIKDFEEEKSKLKTALNNLLKKGPAGVDGKIHPFFGTMTPQEWSNLMNKHLDHHLRQFGA